MRVLQSVRGPSRTTNPYITQLVDALGPETEVAYFNWRRGILGRYDLVHLHWPEVMVRREGFLARAAARIRFAAFLLRLSLLGTPVVRTVHNIRSHESGDVIERGLLRWCEKVTTGWILLNPDTPVPGPGPTRVILHGHYRAVYPTADAVPVPGRILNFGIIRPYKGVERLLATFRAWDFPNVSLRVVGTPTTDLLRQAVDTACADDSRISAHLDYVDEAQLAAELAQAQFVVLPYRELHNSGAALLALSLNRPVLVPRGPTTEALAAEIGAGWVLLYDGELEPSDLEAALRATGSDPAAERRGGPDLTAREWPTIAEQHRAFYQELVSAGRRR